MSDPTMYEDLYVNDADFRRSAGEALRRAAETLHVQVGEMQQAVAGEMLSISNHKLGPAVRRLEPLARVLTFLCDLETDLECALGAGLEIGAHVLLEEASDVA